MSTTPSGTDDRSVDLSLAEQWVVHHVLLDRLEAAEDEAGQWWAIAGLRKIEAGETAFSCFEAWRLRAALSEYAEGDDAPAGDTALASRVVDRLDDRFEAPPRPIEN